jgi:hypothetical protein
MQKSMAVAIPNPIRFQNDPTAQLTNYNVSIKLNSYSRFLAPNAFLTPFRVRSRYRDNHIFINAIITQNGNNTYQPRSKSKYFVMPKIRLIKSSLVRFQNYCLQRT